MKKIYLLFMAIMFFVMQGWTQTTLNEGFEGTTFPPEDLTKVTTQGSVSWNRYTSDSPRETACASVNYGSPNHTNYLITPKLSVTAGLDTISFWIKCPNYYSGTTLTILVSTTDNDVSSFNTTSILTLSNSSFTTTWTKHSVTLTDYIGQNIYIAFKVEDANGLRLMLDDVTGPNLFVPTCPTPSALATSNITTTSALLTWTENGYATDWIIEYKPSSSTTWTTYQTTSNPDSIINLLPGTSYTARLRSVCSAGDSSLYSNTITFQTPCSAQAVPTPVEGFLTLVPPTTCWSLMQGFLPATGTTTLSSITYGWHWNSNVTPHNATLAIFGYFNYWLISPSIDLGDGTSPAQLEFDVFYTAHNSSNAAGTSGTDDRFAVVVSTDNGLTWNVANATIWSNATGATRVLNNIPNTPVHIILPLSDPATTLPYTGNIKIGFYGESTVSNANNDIHIDNFEVRPYTTCQRPTSVIASNITSTDVNINFTENGSSTSWEYVYGDATTITDPTTEIAFTTTTNPIQLTGLTPQTQYNIWVRSICDNGSSDWSVISTFVTEALPATIPYTCDFENATENLAWRPLSNGINKWVTGTASGNGNTTIGTQANYISNDNGVSYAINLGNIYAYSYRDIDFGTDPASYNLTFDWKCKGNQSSYDNTIYAGLKVYLRDPSEVISTSGLPTNPNDNLGTYYNASTWQHAQLPIDNISGVKRLVFVYFNRNYIDTIPAAIDNISLSQATCLRPDSVLASNLTTTTSEISWVHPGADSYIVSYRTDTIGATFTDEATTTSPYTIQGLTLGTQYLVSVRAICGSDTTIYSSNITFQTPCVDAAINQYPYIDDFSSGISCWLSLSSGTSTNGFWQSVTSGNYPTTTPHSPSNMLYFNSNNTLATGYLISSEFYIPESTPMAVDFWMVRDGANNGFNEYVEILVNSSQSITGAISLGLVNRNKGMTPIETVAGWHEYLFTVPDSITGSRYFIIKAQGAGAGNMFVDDFSVISLSCPTPSGITASNITTTTADISWTGTDDATAWNIEYKAASDATWTVVPVTTNPSQISGLVAATSYLVRVQTDCGTDGLSNYGSSTFITPCADGAISSFPWTEGFENGFTCWQQEFVNGILNWTNPSVYNSTQPHEGTKIALFAGISRTNKTKLVSPLMDITSLSTPYLSYWYIIENWGNTDRDTLRVYSRPSSDSSWTLLSTFYALDTYSWNKDSVALPNPSSTYQIAFEGIERYGHGVGLDDITVYNNQTAPCPNPISVLVSNITNTTADVVWTAGGSETSWEVRLEETGVPVTATNTMYPLTGLTSGTTYTVYVRANCGTGYSAWVASTPFTTTQEYQAVQVTTIAPTAITQTNAIFQGTYVQGSEAVTAIGFEYKTTTETTWTDQAVTTVATPFTYSITTLLANTNYEVRGYAVTPTDGRVYGTSLTFITPAIVEPTVSTAQETGTTQNSTTLNGSYVEGTNPILVKGFEWKEVSASIWTIVPVSAGTSPFSYTLNGLTPNTQYEFRAYVETSLDTTYGSTLQFSTLVATPPSVTTEEPNPITNTSATFHGTITQGSEEINARGFEYKLPTEEWADAVVLSATGTNSISAEANDLQPYTSYNVRAYARTNSDTYYGQELNFQTLTLTSIDKQPVNIMMYPNPATNETKLIISGVSGDTKIVLSDVQGRILNIINTKAINGVVEQTIDVNNLAKGVYYIRIENSNLSRTNKLIVK